MTEIANACVLVTGGAGFVGSNLVRLLLQSDAAAVHIVDNLLSAERVNVPDDPRVRFDAASIADDDMLRQVRDEYDYIFHLCTYHSNQSSIQNPLADHEHNQLATLKLFEHIKAREGGESEAGKAGRPGHCLLFLNSIVHRFDEKKVSGGTQGRSDSRHRRIVRY